MWDVDTGNIDGKVYGKSGDKTAHFGTPPSPQRSNPMQAMIGALPLGTLLTAAANDGALALAVTATTTAGNITFAPAVATDFVMAVSKPTANAGYGIGGIVVPSANTINLVAANPTAANVTPTPNETVSLAIFRGMNTITANLTPANVAANSVMEQVFTVGSANAVGIPIVNAAGQLVGANVSTGGTGYLVPPTVVFSTSNLTGPLLPYPNILTGTMSGAGGEAIPAYGTYPDPSGSPVTTVKVTLANVVLPTAIAQVYGGAVIGIQVTYSGQNLPTSGLTMSFVGGNTISPGMICQVNAANFTAGSGIGNVRVVGNNQVGITFFNLTAAAVAPYAGNYTFLALNSIPAMSQFQEVVANLAAPSNISANVNTAVAINVPGIASDTMLGVAVATNANIVVSPGVSSANASNFSMYGIVAANSGAGAYTFTFLRSLPQPPMFVYSVYLTPSAVANNTTAEQIFTLPAALLVAGNPVLVNKPSVTNGISIVNARANSVSTLGITFMNQTGANVTPPAEQYLFASFPGLIPTIGTSGANSIGYGYSSQLCGITWNQIVNLPNELQQTLAQKGYIAGA
jgi:hypothetical protein